MGKVVIFSAPSGSGKTTVVNHLLQRFDCFAFSVSATSRAPRGAERDGEAYYFISADEFRRRAAAGDFVEYEEVYQGVFYGTLKSEVERIWAMDKVILFDVDVKGGVNIKKFYGDEALSLFIQPPSVEELRRRLEGRGTDTPEAIAERLAKAEYEMTFAPQFDRIIVNDDLETAKQETLKVVKDFLG